MNASAGMVSGWSQTPLPRVAAHPAFLPTTVIDLFRQRVEAEPDREICAFPGRSGCERLTWSELLARAAASARFLADSGVGPGAVIGVVRACGSGLLADFLGAILLGAVPCMLAPPNPRMSPAVFAAKLTGILGRFGDGAVVVGDAAAAGVLRGMPAVRCLVQDRRPAPADPAPWLDRACQAEDLLFLQHSSGTTGIPKGVAISHGRLLGHLRAYGDVLGVGSDDRIASWLPWYHDMGMVACLWGSLVWDVPALYLDNFAWALDPASLIDHIARERSTLVWQPNFAFAHLARTVPPERTAGRRLDSVRVWTNCSEPVLASSIDAFCARFAAEGVRPGSVAGCYGMAENVFAVTQSALPPCRLDCDRQSLEVDGRYQPGPGRTLVSSGRPIPGVEIGVWLADGRRAEDGQVGNLRLRGPWRLGAYWRRDEETVRAIDGDGWYDSGDLGFIHAGEVFVIGRAKDLLIVAGRNCDPTEIETLAGEDPGVLPGRCCCLGIDDAASGTQELHLVVESRLPGSEHPDLIRRLRERIARDSAFRLRRVWIAPERWLVKSSSGKISRRENLIRLSELESVGIPAGDGVIPVGVPVNGIAAERTKPSDVSTHPNPTMEAQ